MSEPSNHKRAPAAPRETAGILASLPNTRPQRPSARRARATEKPAANGSSAPASRTNAKAKKAPTKTAPKPKQARKAANAGRRAPKTLAALAPRQGFEVGSEVEQGLAVGPPSSIELAGSIVGLLGEVAQAGAVSGGRLLRDALARLQGR